MSEDTFVKKTIALAFMFLLVLLAFIVLRSILISIVFGLILAYVFRPIYKLIRKKIPNKNFAVALLILGIIIVIAIPLFFITPMLIQQSFQTYHDLQSINFVEQIQKVLPSIVSPDLAKSFAIHLNNIISKLFSSLLNQLTLFIADLPSLLLQLVVVVFTFFFTVRDAEELKSYVTHLSPFSESTERKFLREFRNITNAIIYGQFLIALVQSVALGLGMLVLGVPKALMLSLLAFFASVIPMLGAWLVWLPVSIYLFSIGKVVTAVILILYGSLFVSVIDNIIRPYFLSKETHLSVSIGLIGIIGGLYAFGIIGLVLGPLILAYVIILIDFYRQGKLNELFKK